MAQHTSPVRPVAFEIFIKSIRKTPMAARLFLFDETDDNRRQGPCRKPVLPIDGKYTDL
jgi:hypothetical protein